MEKSERDSARAVHITRRMLIITWVWGIATLSAIGGIAHHLFRERKKALQRRLGTPEERLIREHFSYLTIDPDGLHRFLREYRHVNGPVPLKDGSEVRRFLDTFLFSTDFFPQGADESRVVHFNELYDIYANPCYMPLPRYPIPTGGRPMGGDGPSGGAAAPRGWMRSSRPRDEAW